MNALNDLVMNLPLEKGGSWASGDSLFNAIGEWINY